MKSLLTFLLALSPLIARAYIPPGRMIIERTAENAGAGAYTIEQEVHFPNDGGDPLVLKETWQIDKDRGMHLTVKGPGGAGGALRMQIVYAGGQRWVLREDGRRESSPVPVEFAERPFHWRTLENALQQLNALKLVPASVFQKKPLPRRVEDIRHDTDPWIRLSRSGGVVTWAFGTPSPAGSVDKMPGLWIEQDQFLIRKIRYPTQAEIIADNYSSYQRGLQFPKNRSIQWGSSTVNLRVTGVTARGPTAITASSLDASWNLRALDEQPARPLVEEFYKRFR